MTFQTMSLQWNVLTGISAANLQTNLNTLSVGRWQIVQIVFDQGTSSYTIIAQQHQPIAYG